MFCRQQSPNQHDLVSRRNVEGQLGHGKQSQDPVATPAAVGALADFKVCACQSICSGASLLALIRHSQVRLWLDFIRTLILQPFPC